MPEFQITDNAKFPLGRFPRLDAPERLVHGVSTRRGPDFATLVDGPAHASAARKLARALGLKQAAWMRQVHGGKVIHAEEPGLAGAADALVTATPGLALLGRSADCPLVMAAALDGSGAPIAVGVAHASWKGTVAGVTQNMLRALEELSGIPAGGFVAALAPSAGPCCYEVGPEVREAALSGIGGHADRFFHERDGRLIFDLWKANLDQLAQVGVPRGKVGRADLCTICDEEHFHSWRRDGAAAGRFAAAIGVLR